MKKSIYFALLLLLLPTFLAAQTSYYVSSSGGNDLNTGRSIDQAWRSLEKVNSFKPAPGDKILFKRGDWWEGTLTVGASGTSGNPVVYGAYGVGEKPRILGSKRIEGWTLHSGKIYKAKVYTGDFNQLFINGERIQLARYPKKGYCDVTTSHSTTKFASTGLKGDINYTGATAVIRTNAWGMATKIVTASSSNTITVNSAPQYTITVGDGFFLNNKLEFLTAPGEYYYDSAAKTVYLWTPNGDNPENYRVRGSVLSNLLYLYGKQYVTIENIELSQSSGVAAFADYCNYLTLDKLDILNADSKGIFINHDKFGTYQNIKIDGANHIAFHAQYTSYSNITDNTITNTAMFENLGLTGMGGEQDGRAFTNSAGTDNIIRYNRIENVGYSGISWRTPNTIIDKNFIKNVCMVKDDGGAIYTFSPTAAEIGSAGSKVTNNIVLYSRGTSEGIGSIFSTGYGIYMDNNVHDVVIENNTVAFSGQGAIHLHQNKNILVTGNTLFDARFLVYADQENGDCTVSNNIMYGFDRDFENYSTVKLVGERNGATHIYKNNKYYNPLRSEGLFRCQENYYDFVKWQSTVAGRDAGSTFVNTPLKTGEKEELFYNDTKETKTFELGIAVYRALDGTNVSGKISLEPFTSRILIKTTQTNQVANQKPVIQNQNFDITEKKSPGSLIGRIVASDPDPGQTLRYSIVQGNEAGLFTVNSSSGEILANTTILADLDRTFTLVVQVTDDAASPLSASASVTINIKRQVVNQVPVIYDQSFTILDNLTVSSLVGSVVAFDPDAGQTLSYSVTQGSGQELFSLNPTNGEIRLKTTVQGFSDQTFYLVVRVTDSGINPLSASAVVTINVISKSKPVKGEVNGKSPKKVVLYFNKSLEDESVPEPTDFILSNGKTVQQVSVDGDELYLDICSDYQPDDEVTVTYISGQEPLVDVLGLKVDSFENYVVDNKILNGNNVSTNLFESELTEVAIYPNPTNGIFNIEADNLGMGDCEVALYSMTGKLVAKKQLSTAFGNLEERIDMSHLARGTYIVQLVSEKEIHKSKIIIM